MSQLPKICDNYPRYVTITQDMSQLDQPLDLPDTPDTVPQPDRRAHHHRPGQAPGEPSELRPQVCLDVSVSLSRHPQVQRESPWVPARQCLVYVRFTHFGKSSIVV